MSLEAIAAVNADLARVSSAAQQLAAAQSQVVSGPEAKPGEIQRGQAAVQAAEANLEQAKAALQAAQAQATQITTEAAPTDSTAQTAQTAPAASNTVTDPGGIVV